MNFPGHVGYVRQPPPRCVVYETNTQCDQLRADLVECLKKSDCMRVEGRTGKECLTHHLQSLPPECQQAYHGFVECKRSLWDMRKRFRGIPGAEYSTSSTTYAALDKRLGNQNDS